MMASLLLRSWCVRSDRLPSLRRGLLRVWDTYTGKARWTHPTFIHTYDMHTLCVCQTPKSDVVTLNLVYVGPGVLNPSVRYVRIAGHVFTVGTLPPHVRVQPGHIALNLFQRRSVGAEVGQSVAVEPLDATSTDLTVLDTLAVEVDSMSQTKPDVPVPIDPDVFLSVFRQCFTHQLFATQQWWAMDFDGNIYLLHASDASVADKGVTPSKRHVGFGPSFNPGETEARGGWSVRKRSSPLRSIKIRMRKSDSTHRSRHHPPPPLPPPPPDRTTSPNARLHLS